VWRVSFNSSVVGNLTVKLKRRQRRALLPTLKAPGIGMENVARNELSQSDRDLLMEPSERERLHLLTFLQEPESVPDSFACR
jgi:hypothetical protein